MSPNDEDDRPPERPDYKVYRSRKGFQLPKPGLTTLREKFPALSGEKRQPSGPGKQPKPERVRTRKGRPWLKYAGFAALGWLLLSFVAFGISAQIQKGKLANTGDLLGGNPLLAAFPQNILVLGTDARSKEFAATDEVDSTKCLDAAAHGEATANICPEPARADSIMILRAGGGSFSKLSIPRDTYAAIPGQDNQKINAAYAFGGAKLQIQTVEKFLGININHVAIVDFGGLRDFINAIGGVEVKIPRPVCNSISGGAFKINFPHAGTRTLNGDQALTLARTRETTCPDKNKDGVADSPIDDTDRAEFQQLILSGIKGRLTSPLRIPINFIKGPLIGWNAPKAIVSDMGVFTMPQLVFAAVIGGSSDADVLKPSAAGPGGSLVVAHDDCVKAVKKLTGSPPDNAACSPGP